MFSWYTELWNAVLESDVAIIGIIMLGGATIGAIIFVLSLLSTILKGTNSKNEAMVRGERFEEYTISDIKKYLKVPTFSNVLIPLNFTVGGVQGTAEADIIFINTKGIFCVECKSHKGDIGTTVEGSLSHKEWNVYGETIDMMRNPFSQTDVHIDKLKKYLESYGVRSDINIINAVIINNKFVFTYFGKTISNTYFLHLKNEKMMLISSALNSGLKAWAKEINNMPDVLTPAEVENISSLISDLQGTEEQRKEHIEYVNKTH